MATCRNQSEVESALQQTMTQVKASSEANLKRISEVQGAVAAGVEVQAATALRLEKQLSGQLDDQRESATRLEKRLVKQRVVLQRCEKMLLRS